MRNVLRVVSLGFIVSAAMLSNAYAGNCRVQCTDGRTWSGSTSNGTACCAMIASFCGGSGGATYNGLKCDSGGNQ